MSNSQNILYIKNMVCNRCIKVVKEELEKLGVYPESVTLGEVVVNKPPQELPLDKIKAVMEENGFELLEDKRAKIIEKIKNFVIKHIYDNDNYEGQVNFSKLIENELNMDYNYLSNLFSSMEGITIEHYIILQKIERAKELLKYGELTLSEIAYKLGYSSVQHLSNQFKKVTGLTASQFKSITRNIRKPLDQVS